MGWAWIGSLRIAVLSGLARARGPIVNLLVVDLLPGSTRQFLDGTALELNRRLFHAH
jgi:hypothetical protein